MKQPTLPRRHLPAAVLIGAILVVALAAAQGAAQPPPDPGPATEADDPAAPSEADPGAPDRADSEARDPSHLRESGSDVSAPVPGKGPRARSERGARVGDDGTSVVLEPEERVVELGCEVSAHHRGEHSVWVVCVDGRLLRIALSGEGEVVEAVEVRGRAVGLFDHGGQLWVELSRREAMVLGQAGPAAPGGGPPPPPADRGTRYAPRPPAPVDTERPPVARSDEEGEEDEEGPSYGSRIAPPRVPGWEIAAAVRPFLGDQGGGILGDASIGWRAEAPFFLRVRLAPAGGGWGEDGNHQVFGAALLLGFDHRLFEVGLGVGTARVEVDEFDAFAQGFGTSILATTRLGARDGLHVETTHDFVLVDGELFYGAADARIQVPLSEGTWLLLQGGGGGATGHGWGELALRLRLRDWGDGRGFFVIPGVGGAGVFSNVDFDGFGGASIAFGVEARL